MKKLSRHKSFTILLSALLMHGCANVNSKLGEAEGVVARLIEQAPEIAPVNNKDVIKKYRNYLKIAAKGERYNNALIRLADLELESAEQHLYSEHSDSRDNARKSIEWTIKTYKRYLADSKTESGKYSAYYQLAKAYTLLGKPSKSLNALNQLAGSYPNAPNIAEVQFRIGEIQFANNNYGAAINAYHQITLNHTSSRFYEKALYKLAWSYYKLNKYQPTLSLSLRLLDRQLPSGKKQYINYPDYFSNSQREITEDTIRLISLAFLNKDNNQYIAEFFSENGKRAYEPLIYQLLSRMHMEKGRISDSAEIFKTYIENHAYSVLAPGFNTKLIEIYQKQGNAQLVLIAKAEYVERFGVGTEFWQVQTQELQKQIIPRLEKHLRDLSQHYHAKGKETQNVVYYKQAERWYRNYIRSFPENKDVIKMNFLLAEALFDAREYVKAANEYEKTAYEYPRHLKASEAGYSALLCYQKLRKMTTSDNFRIWQRRNIDSAFRFRENFPLHSKIPTVLLNLSKDLLSTRDFPRAIEVSDQVLHMATIRDKELKTAARKIYSDANYENKNYKVAENSYKNLLSQLDKNDKDYQKTADRLVHSIYQQGLSYRDEKNYQLAAFHFNRAGNAVAHSKHLPNAVYDAAAMYMKLKDWNRAIVRLSEFRKRFPKDSRYKQDVAEKLAIAYSKTGQRSKAATEMLALAENYGNATYQKDMLWLAAEMYHKAGNDKDAAQVYKTFLKRNSKSLTESVEALYFLADFYKKTDKAKSKNYWLNRLIKTENKTTKDTTIRTAYLAAKSALELAHPQRELYIKTKLTIPLKKSTRNKMRHFKNTIKAYEAAMEYQVEEIHTEAIYQIARLYKDFAESMINSQRPKKLSAEELEQYEMLLEEQAYPFEEKSIEFHSLNTQYARDGIFNTSVRESFHALKELHPARYRKAEKVLNYVDILN